MGDTLRPIATPSLPQTRPSWRTANAPAATSAQQQQQQRAYPTPPPSSKRDSSTNSSNSALAYSPLLPFFDPAATAAPPKTSSAPRPAAPAAHPPHAASKGTGTTTTRRPPTLDEFLGPRDSRDAPPPRDAQRRPSGASLPSPHGSSIGTLPSPSPVPTAGPSRLAWAAPSSSSHDRQERRYSSASERGQRSPERTRDERPREPVEFVYDVVATDTGPDSINPRRWDARAGRYMSISAAPASGSLPWRPPADNRSEAEVDIVAHKSGRTGWTQSDGAAWMAQQKVDAARVEQLRRADRAERLRREDALRAEQYARVRAIASELAQQQPAAVAPMVVEPPGASRQVDTRTSAPIRADNEVIPRETDRLTADRLRREKAEREEREARVRAIGGQYEQQQTAQQHSKHTTDASRGKTTKPARKRTTDARFGRIKYSPIPDEVWSSWSSSRTIPQPSSSSSSRADDIDARRDPHKSAQHSLPSSSSFTRPPTQSVQTHRAPTREDPGEPMYRRNGTQVEGVVYHPNSDALAKAATERIIPVTDRRVERPAVAAAAAPPPLNRGGGKRGPRGPISETSFTAKEHAGASRIPWTLTSARSHNTMYLSKAPTSASSSSAAPVAASAPSSNAPAPTRAPTISLTPSMMLPVEFRTGTNPPVPTRRYESASMAQAVPLIASATAAYPPLSRARQKRDRDAVGIPTVRSRPSRREQTERSHSSRSVSPDRHRRRYPHLWADESTSTSSALAAAASSTSQIRAGDLWPVPDQTRAPPPARRPAKAAVDLSHRRHSPLSSPLPGARRPTQGAIMPPEHSRRDHSPLSPALASSRRPLPPASEHSRYAQTPLSPPPPRARNPPAAAAAPPPPPPVAKRPAASTTSQPIRSMWTANDLGLSPDVDDTPKRPFSILADLATRWSSGTNLECRCSRPHGDTIDLLVSDNEAKHAAEWCRKHVPMWIPGIPSCRHLRNERARGVKLTHAEQFLEAAQYLLALEHIGTDEMGCGFPCAVQLERLSDIAKESLGVVFDQDPDTNSLMCVVFAATFCDFVDVRDLPLLMDRPKSSSPTPEADAEDDVAPSTPFLYISVANWYACGIIGNDDRVFNPDLSFLPGQADLLSELKGVIDLPEHLLPPLQGISLRCMAWVLVQELLTLARKIVQDKSLRLKERLEKLNQLHHKWSGAMTLAFTRQQADLGGALEADNVLQFLRVELCALDLFVCDAMLIFALNRELSTDDYALLAGCANEDMCVYIRKHWAHKVDAAQSMLRALVWLSTCKGVFPTVAILSYILEAAKTVVEISGVSYKMRAPFAPSLRHSFDAVAAWVDKMAQQKAEVFPYPLSLTRHFVKSSQQAMSSWEQWTVVRANAERLGQVVPVVGIVPTAVRNESDRARVESSYRGRRERPRPTEYETHREHGSRARSANDNDRVRATHHDQPVRSTEHVRSSHHEERIRSSDHDRPVRSAQHGAHRADDEPVRPSGSGAHHQREEPSRPPPIEEVDEHDEEAEAAPPTPLTPGPSADQTTTSPEITTNTVVVKSEPHDHLDVEEDLEVEVKAEPQEIPDQDHEEVPARFPRRASSESAMATTPPPIRRKRAADPEASPSTPSKRRAPASSPPPSSSPRRSSRLEGRDSNASSPRRAKVANIRFWSAASSDVSTAQLVTVRQV